VRAGLGAPGAIHALNQGLPPGVTLSVRVGMHTGTVIVGEDVFGETPNVAARVQHFASPDTVLVTAETHKLVAGLFLVEECAPQTPQGVAERLRSTGCCSRAVCEAASTRGPPAGSPRSSAGAQSGRCSANGWSRPARRRPGRSAGGRAGDRQVAARARRCTTTWPARRTPGSSREAHRTSRTHPSMRVDGAFEAVPRLEPEGASEAAWRHLSAR